MSFSPDVFKKKLSSLSETQESIVTISQWILFHHRHSKDSAKLWSDYVLRLDSSPSLSNKKLSLFYLANDVVQQARHKRKPEFIRNFAEILPIVFNKVYNTVNESIKPKLTRLIDVWEQRSVFTAQEIKQMKRAIELSKKNKSMGDELDSDIPTSSTQKPTVNIASELTHINTTLIHLNNLNNTNQGNLQQISIQSKTYLPENPMESDNLPSPKIYLSKLNVLEKLCHLADANIKSIKSERLSILKQLESLTSILKNGIQTDESKLDLVNVTLGKLQETRSELQEMVEGDEPEEEGANGSSAQPESPEEPSPALDGDAPFYADNDDDDDDDEDDDDVVPTYENSDVDEDEDDYIKKSSIRLNDKPKVADHASSADEDSVYEPAPKKQKTSRSPSISSGNSTPSSKKSVAFSEDVEVKEYEREERTELIKIVKSDDEYSDQEQFKTDDLYSTDEPTEEFEKHHKDDLELKHERDSGTSGDEYEPASGDDVQNDVLSILSKLS